jgi:cytochrome-b5 reductase
MPTVVQISFVASFLATFAGLFAAKTFLENHLHSLGIYISDLILLGLPKDPNNPQMGSYSFQEYSEHLRSALGSTDIAAIATTPTFILTTTVLLAAFVWTKGFHTGMLFPSRK